MLGVVGYTIKLRSTVFVMIFNLAAVNHNVNGPLQSCETLYIIF